MSADLVNLRKVRKAKNRVEKAETAAVNRARFGRSKAERQVETVERDRMRRHLDGARRPEPDSDVEPR